MPIHDWTKVSAGIYHHFHEGWIIHLAEALNQGILRRPYYALAEQVAGDINPDVLTLSQKDRSRSDPHTHGTTALAEVPPKVSYTQSMELHAYVRKQHALVIRHSSKDRIIAIFEAVSPGNKSSRRELNRFLKKAAATLVQGIHLTFVDLFPPGRYDPQGIHTALCERLEAGMEPLPFDKPFIAASYSAGRITEAFVESLAVGDSLPEMPLFLDPGHYVKLPLELAYQAAYLGLAEVWRDVLTTPS